ncbi:molybdopterin dinucleotide binding domain-containing protein [Actinomadura scrupuli]|uniref:molybdopterin dinucleotide binding domain-containing protein n=1 Tax=Actinomadura scrupuli TaxID=559629 RepID=UPI003D96239B
MTRRTANTELLFEETLDISPADADRLAVQDDDLVEITSRRGSLVLPARVTGEVAPGEVFAAFHFPGTPSNQLTSAHTDTITGCPEYKVTAVALRPVHRAPAVDSQVAGAEDPPSEDLSR